MSVLKRTTPCHDCPWRRNARPGWLGADTPIPFLAKTIGELDQPCHVAIDYEDPEWLTAQEPTAPMCAGSLIFLRNWHKMPRDPKMDEAVRAVTPSKNVFAEPHEFLSHHLRTDVDRATARGMLDAYAYARSVSYEAEQESP